MAHELFRITEKLYNTPHLIQPETLNNIIHYLAQRNTGNVEMAIPTKKRERYVNYSTDAGYGVISVEGPLTYIEHTPMCGEASSSYQQIQEEFDTLANAGVKTIVMDVDSGGGEAYGAFETGQYLRAKADQLGIKLISYVDGIAASAAYALAAAAHEIILNPYAQAGSIGVVVKLRNASKHLEMNGIEDTYIYAGDNKIPFSENGEWRKEFIQDISQKVNATYEGFVQYVSEMRNIDAKAVRQTQAAVYLAEDTLKLGLADNQMTRTEFLEYLSNINRENSMFKTKLFSTSAKAEPVQQLVDSVEIENAEAAYNEAVAKASALEVDLKAKDESFGALKNLLTETETKLADALSAHQSVIKQLNEFKAEREAAEVKAAEVKAKTRKDRIALAVQADKREELFTSTSSLSDEAFNSVLSTLEVSKKTERASYMFGEVGVAAEGSGVATVETETGDILRKQYAQSK